MAEEINAKSITDYIHKICDMLLDVKSVKDTTW